MDNNIHDVQYIAAPEIANTTSDMIALVVNDRYRSLDELCQLIIHTSRHTNQYFYLAVNKFYIYSAKNLLPTSQNYDNTLIEHCYNLVKDKFTLLSANSQPNDRGTLGNFVHPVTTLYLLRHG